MFGEVGVKLPEFLEEYVFEYDFFFVEPAEGAAFSKGFFVVGYLCIPMQLIEEEVNRCLFYEVVFGVFVAHGLCGFNAFQKHDQTLPQ